LNVGGDPVEDAVRKALTPEKSDLLQKLKDTGWVEDWMGIKTRQYISEIFVMSSDFKR
jgi:hypothetical protein